MNESKLAAMVARSAGEELLARLEREGDPRVSEKHFGEQVTNFDREINQFIIDEILAHHAGDDMVTEEADVIDGESEGRRWFIDPIDGTNNFVRNIPLYCVSVGFEKGGVMEAGAIYDPLHRSLFHTDGDKALFQDAPMSVSKVKTLGDAMIFHGLGYDPSYKERHSAIESQIVALTKHQRNMGTAALMLAYIARGDADGFVVTGTKSWDCAAGAALVRMAGGRVTNYKGEDWTPKDEMIIASNGKIHEALLELTK